MECSLCGKKAVFERPDLCRHHFISYFETKISTAISESKMFTEKDRICVAVSGGKDSLSLALSLKVLGYDIEMLTIDEGISGYREEKLAAVDSFARTHRISYKVVSFREEFGSTLDMLVRRTGLVPCTVCGVLRRKLMNRHSKGYSCIATGHNLDDESQSVMMNLLKNSLILLSRQGPVTEEKEGFVRRVKPFYKTLERETLAYSILHGIEIPFIECPYVHDSFRSVIRDFLNKAEGEEKGVKENVLQYGMDLHKKLGKGFNKGAVSHCAMCGEPSSDKVCMACRLLEEIGHA